jgi:hypothetical protein
MAAKKVQDLSGVTSFAELAALTGESAKKLRAIHRRNVRANGGKIGVDTPGRGKTYNSKTFAPIAQSVLDALNASKSDDSE